MSTFQQYQRYRIHRQARARRRWWWLGSIVAIILIIWWLRAVVSSPTPAADTGSANTNAAAATNSTDGNVNAGFLDENANVSAHAAASAFDLDQCTGTISQARDGAAAVALTFNSVRTAGSTEQILQILTQKNIKADFFVTGVWVENNADVANKIVAAGHGLYSLGYANESYTAKEAADLQADFEKVDDIFTTTLNRSPQPFFRPPFGAINDEVFNAAKQYGYCPVVWTFDSLDWSADYTSEEVKNRVVERAASGSILVMQTSNSVVPEILGAVIDGLTAKGLSIRPLLEHLTAAEA